MKNWVEISSDKLAANFRAVQAAAGEDVEVLAVIKADGYGHGATLCAPVLVAAGARWLGVTDAEEGVQVREALGESETNILVMSGSEPEDAAAIVAHGLTPVVWTLRHVEELERAAAEVRKRVAVHVEVDTGMSRQGVLADDGLERVFRRLAESPWLRCEGIMTHLCCSEVAGASTTERSMQRFAGVLDAAWTADLLPEFLHIANTSAVDEGSTMAWMGDRAEKTSARVMVRTGLALYGYTLPLEGEAAPRMKSELMPVLTWKAKVLDVFAVEAGASVGYGATFVAPSAMRVALLAVGYADGFRREGSSGLGNGWVMVRGQKAAVVGRVSMNLTVVDVTGIDGAAVGDEAVLLGEGVTAEDHARWCGTIPYEILCGVRSARVVV